MNLQEAKEKTQRWARGGMGKWSYDVWDFTAKRKPKVVKDTYLEELNLKHKYSYGNFTKIIS